MDQLTLGAVAELIGAKLEGDSNHLVSGLATLASALPHQVSFLANMKYAHQLDSSQAGAVILHADQAQLFSGHCLVLENPYLGYAKLSQSFAPMPYYSAIDKTAQVDPTAVLGRGVNLAAGTVIGPYVNLGNHVSIGPNSVVGSHSKIGEHTIIAANVALYHDIEVGAHCRIHSGAVTRLLRTVGTSHAAPLSQRTGATL